MLHPVEPHLPAGAQTREDPPTFKALVPAVLGVPVKWDTARMPSSPWACTTGSLAV
jgi:hypothetical protein